MSESVDTLLKQAFSAHQNGALDEAERIYALILEKQPQHFDALQLSGVLAHQQGAYENAITRLRQALRLRPGIDFLHFNLGVSLQETGRLEAAEQHYRQALQLNPGHGDACNNLATLLRTTGRLQEARTILEQGLERNPRHGDILYNLASCCDLLGDRQAAGKHVATLLVTNPAHAEGRLLEAEFRLAKQQWQAGWQSYSWRHQCEKQASLAERSAPWPLWDGSDPRDRSLLILAEQGIGDEILFAACLPDLLSTGPRRVSVEADPRLCPLFQRSFPSIRFLPRQASGPPLPSNESLDWILPAGDLPRRFRTRSQDFSQSGYLHADPAEVKRWRKRLDRYGPGLRVGLSWRGGSSAEEECRRSVPVALLHDLFALPNIKFINLQYGLRDEERRIFADFASPLHDCPEIDLFQNLDQLAALISALDLVICIDNATLNLAGALGQNVWGLLPVSSNWRWLDRGQSTPWYPTVRIWRQTTTGPEAWPPVLERVVRALEGLPQPSRNARSLPPQPNDHLPQRTVATPRRGPTAVLLNDTSSWYHWGCSCTSLAIHEQLRHHGIQVQGIPIQHLLRLPPPRDIADFNTDHHWQLLVNQHPELLSKLLQADLVLVNGEGSLHGIGPLQLTLLHLIHQLRRQYDKPVQIINHSCYPAEGNAAEMELGRQLYRQIYNNLTFCGVRETASARQLLDLGLRAELTFDCLPLFIHEHFRHQPEKTPTVLIAGSAAVRESFLPPLKALIATLTATGYNVQLLLGSRAHLAADDLWLTRELAGRCPDQFSIRYTTSELDWLTAIAESRLLVSGRFHHSLAAAFLGTPFIALDTNTRKLAALMEMFSLPWHLSVDTQDASLLLPQIAHELLNNPAAGGISSELRDELLQMSRKNFSALPASLV